MSNCNRYIKQLIELHYINKVLLPHLLLSTCNAKVKIKPKQPNQYQRRNCTACGPELTLVLVK